MRAITAQIACKQTHAFENNMHAGYYEQDRADSTYQALLADRIHAAHPGTWVSLAVVADLHELARLQPGRETQHT
jgi:hypothetical protein